MKFVFVILTATKAFTDVCQLYYDNAEFVCIDETRKCRYPSEITCETAYERVALRFGAVPLPAMPSGLLYVPEIIESSQPVVYTYVGTISTSILDKLLELERNVNTVNSELAVWAPRVLYVPSRIESVFHRISSLVRDLGDLRESLPAITAWLRASGIVSEFMHRVTVLSEVAVRLPDLRRSGFLNALIPYYHLMAEMNFGFDIQESGNMLVDEVSFVQTLAQYDPMYTDGIWRFRIHNPGRFPWRDYPNEQFLLPVPVEHRSEFGTECPDVPVAGHPLCAERVSDKVIELNTALTRLSQEPDIGSGAEVGHTLADILYLLDRLYGVPGYEPVYTSLHHSVRLMCSNSDQNLLELVIFSMFAHTRSQIVLYRFFPECVPMTARVISATTLVPARDHLYTWEEELDVSVLDGNELIDFFLTRDIVNFIPKVIRLTRQYPRWLQFFDTLVVNPNTQRDAATDNWTIRPDVPKSTRRAIGRFVGFSLWNGGETVTHLLSSTFIRSIFFHSEEVRLGAYEWLSYGSFDTTSNFIDVV